MPQMVEEEEEGGEAEEEVVVEEVEEGTGLANSDRKLLPVACPSLFFPGLASLPKFMNKSNP